jgi:hypothetical protein
MLSPMTGTELSAFCTGVNGGETIDDTLLFQFINMAKAIVEHMRPWMILRFTDTSKTVAASLDNTAWKSAIDLSTIARFSRFYGKRPIKLFDGNNSLSEYTQRPFNQRLQSRFDPNTFVFDEGTKSLYFNGTIPYSGTLYIDHIEDSPDITDDDSSTWIFPSWSHPLLGFLAVGIYKGGIDFDDINARMAPDNRAQAQQLIAMLTSWDNEKALSAQENVDPYQSRNGYRPNAVDMDA